MDQATLTSLISKLISDPGFRDEFFNDPAGTAERMGIRLTDDLLARIKGMDRKEFDEMLDKAQKEPTFVGAWAAID